MGVIPLRGPAGAAGAAGATGAAGSLGSIVVRSGTATIASGASTATVTFGAAMPSANYVVSVGLLNQGVNAWGSASIVKGLDVGSLTSAGFVITQRAAGSGSASAVSGGAQLSLSWIAVALVSTPAIIRNTPAVNTYAGAQLLTVTDVVTNGLALLSGSSAGSSNTWTTPTAAALVAAIPGISVGDSFEFQTAIASVDALTYSFVVIAGGAGVTLRTYSVAAVNAADGLACQGCRVLFVATNVSGGSEAFDVYIY